MKVLIITGRLQNYRVPIFNKLVESGVNLTVAHSYKKLDDGSFLFKEVLLEEKSFGPFSYHKENLKKFCSEFDIVIPTFYLQKLSFMRLLLGSRTFKLAYWGIGVKASQKHRFDEPTFLNRIRKIIAKRSDAMIFYTDYVKAKYINMGLEPEKIFVLNNTVDVDQRFIIPNEDRRNILLMGTLNSSKKVFELVKAYQKISKKYKDIQSLEIVGGGEDFERLKSYINENNLSNKIVLHGPVYDALEKSIILNRAICSISPDQAGLSVLETMAFGVPFITHKNAITGGERLNINDERGLLFDDFSELESIIEDIYLNPMKYIKKGESARAYYNKHRSVNNTVKEFFEIINFLK